jgi:hypothetical protein
VVEKIWNFEVLGLFLWIFLRLGTLLGLFFKNPGSNCEIMDCGLILEKPRGFFAKLLVIIDFSIFVRKKSWTQSTGRGPRAALVHGGSRIGPWRRLTEHQPTSHSGPRWLTRRQPTGHSGPRRLAERMATRRGRRSATGEPLTEAWTRVRRQRDGVGVTERRRGQANGVGVFRRGGGPFIGPGEGHRDSEGG